MQIAKIANVKANRDPIAVSKIYAVKKKKVGSQLQGYVVNRLSRIV